MTSAVVELRTPVAQRYTADCGVAALACLLRIPYEDAEAAICAANHRARPIRYMRDAELQRAAHRLGYPMWRLTHFDPHQVEGIGYFRWARPDRDRPNRHFAVVDHGRVHETDGRTYPIEEYLAAGADVRLYSILVIPDGRPLRTLGLA